ncbi:MAG: NUDIX domain-containing protein [Syntrophothermus sp.]
MPQISAGLLLYNKIDDNVKVFLIHPGGPFFAKKDEEHWGIPKGLVDEGEDLLAAAKREFFEECGVKPEGKFIPLGTIQQKNNKIVHCWGVKTDYKDNSFFNCTSFVRMELPAKSGKYISFPEVDKGDFFNLETAKKKIIPAQLPLLERLEEHI